jgi:hypothetical protein
MPEMTDADDEEEFETKQACLCLLCKEMCHFGGDGRLREGCSDGHSVEDVSGADIFRIA